MLTKYLRSAEQRRQARWVLTVLIGLGFCLAAAACQGNSPPSTAVTGRVETTSPGAPVSPPVDVPTKLTEDLARAAWQTGPHAQTFVARPEGKNSDCAHCHAPVEWIPTMDELPESCFTCKFTVAPPPPVIAEDAWTHVNCKVCHEINKKGEKSPGIAWLEIAAIGEYSPLGSTTELCMKCHLGADVSGHAQVQLSGVHAEMTCTQCHDPHYTTAASCGTSGCHTEPTPDPAGEAVAGHDGTHEQVPCAACHYGEGFIPAQNETGEWVTLLQVEAGGETVDRVRTSHNLSGPVQCRDCHFPDNPWGLDEIEE